MQKKIGMVSVTFRQKSVREVIALAQQNNLRGIEWGGDVHVPCGDLVKAREVGRMTRDAALENFSYGSYFRVGDADFDAAVETAIALGCRVIRIWAPPIASALCSPEDFARAADLLAQVCEAAARCGMLVCLEYHNGTMNDCADGFYRLAANVRATNLKTYWQPLYGRERNLQEIAALGDKIENVHVYHWIYKDPVQRKLLEEAAGDWRDYIDLLGARNYLLEFCKDDTEDNFVRDAKTLRKLLGE